jgi:hypothetical protein
LDDGIAILTAGFPSPVTVVAYSINTDQIDLVHSAACRANGAFLQIPDAANAASVIPLFHTYMGVPPNSTMLSWSLPYQDSAGLGLTMRGSAAVLGPKGLCVHALCSVVLLMCALRLAGVVSIEFPIAELLTGLFLVC